jgi:YVTN family beta-propeller protein
VPVRDKAFITAGASILALALIGAGIGAHRWSAIHVEHYTGDPVRTAGCTACHFSARGGTVMDRIVKARYVTPLSIAVCADGGRLYVTAQDEDALLVIDPADREVMARIAVGRRPHGVVLNRDCDRAWVSNEEDDTVSVVDLEIGASIGEIPTGYMPTGLALGPEEKRLYVANWLGDDISVLDLEAGIEMTRLAAGENPTAIAASNGHLLVTNQIAFPAPRPEPPVSEVTVIDAARGRVVERHRLRNAHLLEGVAASPEGDLALVALIQPRNLVPALQVERGWMMTNGLAVIDRESGRVVQLPLDEVNVFYADPSYVAFTPDGRYAFVSHGGVDVVTVIDVAALRALLRNTPAATLAGYANNLGISARYVVKRIPTGSNPRGMALSPDGRTLYVAERLNDRIAVIDVERLEADRPIDLGGPEHISIFRRGEQVFHSAAATMQTQFSCRSCHPNSQVDNLQYDFEPDGIGLNPVDNRSLLGIRDTAPFKWTGKNTSLYMQCGIRFARFLTRTEPFPMSDLNALVAYIGSLPVGHNRRAAGDGELTPAQQRGKVIFERSHMVDGTVIPENNRCITCHPGPYFTDRLRADIGSASLGDTVSVFDTPQLNNLVDTAPYLHDGKALTLEEIWTVFSPEDTHGVTSDVGKEGLNDLIHYLRIL